ncbi:hypothetical protein ONZ45_g7482 [Pleurotus djamor]|nr:hypothetical protein ONZ45_g7482 [Pleurotus djamor]
MSDPNSPTSINEPIISPGAIAAAIERRKQQPVGPSPAQLAAEHDKRQAFRRLINPGITERNSKEVSTAALKILSTIAENLLREPDNAHYRQFKPTNSIIKQRLVDPKGTLEYAIAMGFHAEVKDFQPYYVFNPRKMEDLRLGAAMLKEAMSLQAEKDERSARSKELEKAAREEAALKVKLAFMDDRRSKTMFDEREKEIREARAAAQAALPDSPNAAGDHHHAPVSILPLTPGGALSDDSDDDG